MTTRHDCHPLPPDRDVAPGNEAAARPEWVLLRLEARVRGFEGKHASLKFRRWCKSRRVRVVKDGRREWVCPREIDAVIAGAAPANDTAEARPPAVARAVALLTGGKL